MVYLFFFTFNPFEAVTSPNACSYQPSTFAPAIHNTQNEQPMQTTLAVRMTFDVADRSSSIKWLEFLQLEIVPLVASRCHPIDFQLYPNFFASCVVYLIIRLRLLVSRSWPVTCYQLCSWTSNYRQKSYSFSYHMLYWWWFSHITLLQVCFFEKKDNFLTPIPVSRPPWMDAMHYLWLQSTIFFSKQWVAGSFKNSAQNGIAIPTRNKRTCGA